MDAATFREFRNLVYEMSGITLGAGKESLVSVRIMKRMRALDMTQHREYLRFVKADSTGEEIVHLIDAISTNVTSFFREPEHFDLVRQQVLRWLAAGQTRFRLWSAASSTGEEPYSLAITVQEALGGAQADVRILATDISTRVLRKCQEGDYTVEGVDNVPFHLRERYFDARRARDGIHYAVRPVLRQVVVFRRLNLSQPPFPMHGPFDIVFCRNVMIYFDNAVRTHLLAEIHRLLRPHGFLLVGHAESLTGMLDGYTMVRPSIYRKD